MPISCVYCAGSHARPDEVRACWQRAQEGDAPAPAPAPAPRVEHRSTSGEPAALAGPEALGRLLVVHDDRAAPTPWDAAERTIVDARTLEHPDAALERLRGAHLARRRVVVELQVPFHDPPASTDDRPLHRIGPLGGFPLDELHHLVWSNSVAIHPDGTTTAPGAAAAGLGARPVTDGTADVVLPDGRRAWIDGGPLRWSAPIDGVHVVPAIAVEHGSLSPYGPNDATAELAPDQLAAVTHAGGAARIIAPAGSGKTRVLTERARHLVRAWQLPVGALSLVAYNRRAQEEVQQRLADVPGVQVRTLNAIALAIVNGARPFAAQPQRWTTLGEREVRRILGQFVQAPRRRSVDPLAPWLAALSRTRLGLRDPADVEAEDGDVSGLTEVLPQYEAALRREGAIDFDGQVLEAVRLLLRDPRARRAAQHACRVLLVDEFQDLTPAHVLLLRLLAAPGGHVFGVGDDDQTIYGYNGADPRWLLEYATVFPGAGEHPLEVNYRCPADVVEQVDRLLRRNHRRVPKRIHAARLGSAGMRTLGVADPVSASVDAVRDVVSSGAPPEEVAVLARVNATLVPVQVALRAAGVPVRSVAGVEFLERTPVRSALAWLRLATGGAYAEQDLSEAVRRPSRGLSPRLAAWVAEQRSAAGLARLAGRMDAERDAERVRAFAADLARVERIAAQGTTRHVIDVLCDEIGLAGTLATLDANRHGMNAPSQSDDLLAVRQLASMHDDPATFDTWLAACLREPGAARGVTLATVHRVKGQEWPHVVVHLADADQFPHRLADDVAEERRLFHVALTRTSGQVTVVSTITQPSRFLAELVREPADDEPDADEPQPAPGRASTAVRDRPAARSEPGAKGPLAGEHVVAGPGLVLVDQGHEWVVQGVAPDAPGEVVAVRATSSRRFRFGAKVVTAGKQRGVLAPAPPDLPPLAPALFDGLRRLREQLRRGKPAYTVFDDATLERIACSQPRRLEELARVRGVGPAKLEQYGEQVVALVDDVLAATTAPEPPR